MTLRSQLGRAVSVEGPPLVTAEQRARFVAEGFVVVDDLLDDAQRGELEPALARLLASAAPAEDGMRFDYLAGSDGAPSGLLQLLLPFDYAPELFESVFFRRAATLARDLIGEPLRYRGSHYMEKPGGGGAATPWHQDEAFWEPSVRHEAVAVWLPLDGAPAGSGALRFVPGSHRKPTLASHRRIGGDPAVHGLEIDGPEPSASVLCPLAPGGVTVHHCRTVHGAEPNGTPRARRALVLNFERPPIPLPTPRDVPWQATRSAAAARRDAEGIELP